MIIITRRKIYFEIRALFALTPEIIFDYCSLLRRLSSGSTRAIDRCRSNPSAPYSYSKDLWLDENNNHIGDKHVDNSRRL